MAAWIDIGLLIVAVASVAVAAFSWERANSSAHAAHRSADAAEKSADEAERSSVAAEQSLELSRSERDRAIEKSDVLFKRSPKHRNGVYTYTNIGTSDAHDVTVLAYVNNKRVQLDFPLIESGGNFEIDGSEQYAEAVRVKNANTWARGGMVNIAGLHFVVKGRVSWGTAMGTPGAQELE